MNKKLILGVAAIGVALIIGLSGAPLNSITVSITELNKNPSKYLEQEVKINGVIKKDSVQETEKGTKFVLKDKDSEKTIKVFNNEPVPGQKDEGKTIQVKGTLTKENVFEAKSVTIGCKNTYK